jgi:hypothetical protein
VSNSKVDMLPGQPMTARVMLEKAIERVDQTRDLIIIEYTKEGYVEVYNTVMARSP